MRDSTAFRCRRRPWPLAAAALLVGALSGPSMAAAEWSLRAEPASGGKASGCSMVSFYEVVSRLSEECAQLFQYAGLHRDKHVREHELYEVHGRSVSPAASIPSAAAVSGSPLFPPELLARVTRALTAQLGPMAGVVVERAARQAHAAQLFTLAADSLSGGARDRFLAEVSGPPVRRPSAEPTAPAAAGPPVRSERRPPLPSPITPTVLSTAELRLATYVGPIARVLVAQAAKDASDPGALVDRLALHIDDPAKRAAFVRALDDL